MPAPPPIVKEGVNAIGTSNWICPVSINLSRASLYHAGLVDKYISFDAVLWMHEIGGRLMGEIRGGKTVGFLSKEPVKRVLCNGEDVTALVEKKDCLYLLELNGQNAVVEVE